MALTVGELRAILTADKSGYSRTIKLAGFEHRVFRRDAERAILIDGDPSQYLRALDRARRERNRFVLESARSVAKVGGLTSLAGLSVLTGQAAAGGAVALASGLSQVAGAAALLPAAGVAAAIGVGTMIVAFEGVGDAIKAGDPQQWAEALRNLAPEAQATARAVKALGGSWRDLRMSVQDEFFQGLADEITSVGSVYLPVMRRGLTDVAGAMNEGARGFGAWLREADSVGDMGLILGNTASAFREANPAGVAFAQILRDVTAVGSERLPGLADGMSTVAQRWADMVAAARESGALGAWIDRGMAAAGDVGGIIGNVAGTIGGIFDAGQASGASALTTLRELTQGMEDWAKSAEGQGAAGGFLTAARDAGRALLPVVEALAETLGGDLAPLLADIGEEVAPEVADAITAIGDALQAAGPGAAELFQGFSDLLGELTPLIPLTGELAGLYWSVLGPALSLVAGALGVVVDGVEALPGPMRAAIAVALAWSLVGDRIGAGAGRLRTSLVEPWQRMREQVQVQTALAARDGATNLGKLGAAAATLETHSPVVARMADQYRTWSTRVSDTVKAHAALAGGLGGVGGRITATGVALDKAAGAAARFGGTVAGSAAAGMSGLRSAASGLVGVLGGPWGVALAGAAGVLAILSSRQQEAERATAAHKDRVRALTAEILANNGAITDSIRQKTIQEAHDKRIYDVTGKLGVSQKTTTEALLGNAAAIRIVNTAYDKAGVGLGEFTGNGRQLVDLFGQMAGDDGIGTVARFAGDSRIGFEELSGGILVALGSAEEIDGQMVALGGTSMATTERVAGLAAAAKEMGASVGGAAGRVQALTSALDIFHGDTMTVEDATQRANDSVRGLGEAWKAAAKEAKAAGVGILDANGAINTTTEAGSHLKSTVDTLASSYKQVYAAVYESTGSHEKATAASQKYRDALVAEGENAGLTAAEVESLANVYKMIPGEVTTKVITEGLTPAQFGMAHLRDNIVAVPNDKTIIVSSNAAPHIEMVKRLGYNVKELPDGRFEITANTADGQTEIDAFIARNNFRQINIQARVTMTAPTGLRGIPTKNAVGRVMEYYADGGMRPMSAGSAAIVGSFRRTGAMRVIGDNPTHDELYAPLNRSERTKALMRIGMDRTWPGWQDDPSKLFGDDVLRRQMAAQRPDYWTSTASRGGQPAGGQAPVGAALATGGGRAGNTFNITGPDARQVAREVVDQLRVEEMLYGRM